MVKEVLARNEEVIRVLDVNGMIKGHYAFLPLNKAIYEKVLDGELDEKELADHIGAYFMNSHHMEEGEHSIRGWILCEQFIEGGQNILIQGSKSLLKVLQKQEIGRCFLF